MKLIAIDRTGAPGEALAPLSDIAREVCAGTAALYDSAGFEPPWIGYFGVVNGEVVGTCAFKAPARDGCAEIAYFTFPPFEGRGLAGQMVQQLVALAAEAQPGIVITAQTLAERNASTSVLKRLGFRFTGPVEHPEDGLVWEWALQTPAPGAADAPESRA